MIHELREYVAHPGAAQRLHDRFRDVTLPLFRRHGLEVVGFGVDRDDPSRIQYLLRFDDSDAQRRAWSDFQNDPQWIRAKQASEAAGPIVASMCSRTLDSVSYWPDAQDGECR